MAIDDQIVVAMQPGKRHAVTEIAVEVNADYGRVFFSLSRLCEWGFAQVHDDNYWSLTEFGEQLREILARRI